MINKRIKRKKIYLLPNIITTSSLFFGFYSIILSLQSDKYLYAVVTIFIAMVLDTLDGRIARLTNTQTDFGAEYDSLSDLVAFGVAPSILAYQWGLSSLHIFSLSNLGWLVAFFYTATTALRLARFNAELTYSDNRFFRGVPCPISAGLIASFIAFCHAFSINEDIAHLLISCLMILASILMVSNIKYLSFKEINLKGKVNFFRLFLVLLVFVIIALDVSKIMFLIFFCYLLSGPGRWLWLLWLQSSKKNQK